MSVFHKLAARVLPLSIYYCRSEANIINFFLDKCDR